MSFYIGIDCGEHNGVAVYTGKELKLFTLTFWELIDWIDHIALREQKPSFIVEDPGLNKNIFAGHNGFGKNIDANIAQKVGRNKQDARRIIQRIKSHSFLITEVRPNTEKWDAKWFEKLYRSKFNSDPPSSNEHNRDAAKLISHKWL